MQISSSRRRGLGLLGVVAALLASSCGGPLLPDRVRPAAGANEPRIAIIRSSDNPLYEKPTQNFVDSVAGEVSIFTYVKDKESALARAVNELKPAAVFTIGSQATVFARAQVPDVPIVFAMVVDYGRFELGNDPRIAGVALETSIRNEFSQFKMVMPNVTKVLSFYSPKSKKNADKAKEELQKLGITLEAIEVAGPEEVSKKFPATISADAIWQMNDPVIFTEETFNTQRDRSHELKIPFFASLSEEFAKAGAFAAVSVDFTSLGSQAATIVRSIISGQKPSEIGVQEPIGAYLALNIDVAKKINVEVSPTALLNVNKLFSSELDQLRLAAAEEAKAAGVTSADEAATDEGDGGETAVAANTTGDTTATTDPKATDPKATDPKAGDPKGTDPKGNKPKDDPKKDPEAVAKAEPPKPKKPRDGRTVIFYDPDANHEAILQITSWFTEFLRTVDPKLKLQPVRSTAAFEKMMNNGQVDFAILPSSYVARKQSGGKIVPLLVPSSKGEVKYRKALFQQNGSSKMATVAAATSNTKEVLKMLSSAGVKTDGVTIIPVSKDIDALLALVFGQVDGALVMAESMEVIKTIQPGADQQLKKVQDTRAITRTPLCAIPEAVPADYQQKLVTAMKQMNKNASGARAMRTLGLDSWVGFEASMLK
jgi:ABC-type uncharacterized transport system substrate-binding protein/ABC-type phosphate/phosphonate transport system substrate-binding protein